MAAAVSQRVVDDKHDSDETSCTRGYITVHLEEMKPFGGYGDQMQHQHMGFGVDCSLWRHSGLSQTQNAALEYKTLSFNHHHGRVTRGFGYKYTYF